MNDIQLLVFISCYLIFKLTNIKYRFYFKGHNYDPIDFELFGDNDAWILVDEPSELTSEELEIFHHELASCSIQENDNNGEQIILLYSL